MSVFPLLHHFLDLLHLNALREHPLGLPLRRRHKWGASQRCLLCWGRFRAAFCIGSSLRRWGCIERGYYSRWACLCQLQVSLLSAVLLPVEAGGRDHLQRRFTMWSFWNLQGCNLLRRVSSWGRADDGGSCCLRSLLIVESKLEVCFILCCCLQWRELLGLLGCLKELRGRTANLIQLRRLRKHMHFIYILSE